MFFDLQRFGSKNGTTIQSTYEPTQYELELQQLEVNFTNAIMPNALALNSKAKNLLDSADSAMTGVSSSLASFTHESFT